MDTIWAVLAAFILPFPFLARRAWRNFERVPQLPGDGDFPPRFRVSEDASLPAVSIIIPARDEAANLQVLLPSLRRLDYPAPTEVIVVDDGSTDGTAAIAAGHGARVLPAGPLPAGWLGKPHACHLGAAAAAHEWLLFTDADTAHTPDSLSLAAGYALAHNLDGLSLFLDAQAYGIPDKLALTAAFAGLFAGWSATRPLINGQYILIRKAVYYQSGGFEAVRAEKLEDLALAHLLASHGFQVPAIRSSGAAEVRMYENFKHLWKGLTRLGAGSLKWAGPGGWLTALFITGALLPVLILPAAALGYAHPGWALAYWLVVPAFLVPWARQQGSAGWAILLPFGALLVQLAASWGLVRTVFKRGVSWKGRMV